MLLIILAAAVIMIFFPGFLAAIVAILGMCLLATIWGVPSDIAGPAIAGLVILRFVSVFFIHVRRIFR